MSVTAKIEFPAPDMIGAFKTFGPFGPAYEILAPVRLLPDGDWMVLVRILASGEESEYRYTHALDDPKAA